MNYKLSIIVPLHNEEENLPELTKRLAQTAQRLTSDYEIIFVNDGSTDNSEGVLSGLIKTYDHTAVINLIEKGGKAAALERGFDIATGDYAVIIDSDLQHLPEDIPLLIEKMEEGCDVVSGQRTDRHDNKLKVLTSKIFNIIVRLLVHLDFQDYFSGLKCFRMSMMRELKVYGDLFRFVAVLGHQRGFKVAEIPITHKKREHGTSKYNFFTRLLRGIQDLIVIIFFIVFSKADRSRLSQGGFFMTGLGLILIIMEFVYHGHENFSFSHFYSISACAAFVMAFLAYLLFWALDFFYQVEAQAKIMRRANIKDMHKNL